MARISMCEREARASTVRARVDGSCSEGVTTHDTTCRRPARIEPAPCESLQLPGDPGQRHGIVGAAPAGLDRDGEMAAEGRVPGANLRERSLDRLRHHQPGALGVGRGLPASTAQPHRAGELIAKRLELGTETRCPERIVEAHRFGELLAELAHAATVFVVSLLSRSRPKLRANEIGDSVTSQIPRSWPLLPFSGRTGVEFFNQTWKPDDVV